MIEQAQHLLLFVRRKYTALRWTSVALWVFGCSLISASIAWWLAGLAVASLTVLCTTLLVLFLLARQGLLKTVTPLEVAHLLNRFYPELQDSADLLIVPLPVNNSLAPLQQQRVATKAVVQLRSAKIPYNLRPALMTFVTGVITLVVVTNLSPLQYAAPASLVDDHSDTPSSSNTLPKLLTLKVHVAPPAYTKLSPYEQEQPAVKLVSGGEVTWRLSFSSTPDQVQLVLSGRDTIAFIRRDQSFSATRSIVETGYYQLIWSSDTLHSQSEYFPIQVVADEPPQIAVKNMSTFTEVKLNDSWKVQVEAGLTDDFGIIDAQIVATVSKGSGESVKFREEKMRFSQPDSFGFRKGNAHRGIDLRQLGLEPGDELYFYVEASDNRNPLPNHARTETFFVAVQDTATQAAVADEGLGVDLMPDYFRSQRQIIIDTEKLLAAEKRITRQEFNATSNELGYDQKVLRLRYGQFLGEEFETAIAKVDDHEDAESAEEVMKQYGHQHDTENEHHQVAEKKTEPTQPDHDHEHTPGGEEKENPFEAFVHSHDNAEEATFYIQSVKAKLRAALTLMWDAELQLRLYEPAKSLPTQYKILKLLKEISNDSRVYVHRTGFDPPPLKEEKRLSGDLSEIKDTRDVKTTGESTKLPAIRAALPILSMLQHEGSWSNGQRQLLERAGNEFATFAVQDPVQYLSALGDLRKLINTENGGELRSLANKTLTMFMRVLPESYPSPDRLETTLHPIDQQLLRQSNRN